MWFVSKTRRVRRGRFAPLNYVIMTTTAITNVRMAGRLLQSDVWDILSTIVVWEHEHSISGAFQSEVLIQFFLTRCIYWEIRVLWIVDVTWC